MPRGQSKTPAEKAAEAVEAQQKDVDKLQKDVDKLQKDIEKAQETLKAADADLAYQKDILAVLKRHPALGQAPVNLGPNLHEQHVHVENRDVNPDEAIDPDLDITYGVETAKVEARPDAEGSVRASMISATPTTETPDEENILVDVPVKPSVGSSASRNPWQV